MTWEIFAAISIVTTSIAALFERALMKDDTSEPISFAIIFQFFCGFVTWGFALFFGKFTWPHDPSMWFRYLISASLWAGATVASLKAMKYLQVGEATIIGTSSTIVSVTLGMILFSEKLSAVSVLGIALIFLAIWIVSSEKLSFKSKTGIVFAFASAICGGIAVINDIIILNTYEAFSYTTIMSLLPGLMLLGIFPKRIFKQKSAFTVNVMKKMMLLAIFYSIQAIAYYVAIEHNAPISKLSPIMRSSIILTVILAAIFLKEQLNMGKKIFAAIVVAIGATLVS